MMILMYVKHLFTYLLRCVSLCMCEYAYVCSCVQYTFGKQRQLTGVGSLLPLSGF